jgi:S-formylglutathione hydrolase FrmB
MAVAAVQFRSEAMGRQVTYNVILPDISDGPYPVLLQMHGLGDDHQSWIQRSNLTRYVADLGLAVVLPDGASSGYLNWKAAGRLYRQRYEDMIMTDIAAHVKRHFNVSDGPWAIGGLSMGGYGAMRLGLKFPERFASIWAHSSAFHIHDVVPGDLLDVGGVEDADVFRHAGRLKASGATAPVISFDCGVDDELIGHNRDLHAHLDRLGLEHHYAEHPGAHTWDYWDLHVRDALEQHAQVLGVERVNAG